ncbi:hypothetical protein JOD57_003873 [Geodermatophilus bullaregiensis]|uniref:hypothetical protein n=1 Tax=Geodermatophilus bullaregiensis TaxID=1564160 RepID=UPI00195DA398|nr:hypothetical protein [Geodermatophilus bullaregiensis]MBM7808036.1 hypothetical protein [Geodermatophilus bullaregiensis]
MTVRAERTVGRSGGPRPPGFGSQDAFFYKDWLHVNVVDQERGAVGLVNASLHGDPRDPRAVAVGAALLHLPGRGWLGGVHVVPQQEAVVGHSGIFMESVAVSVDGRTGTVAASMRTTELTGELIGTPAAPSTTLPVPLPFGSGWIGWSVTPRLHLTGSLHGAGTTIGTHAASGYHDHNWGRWRWGDDLGWDWAALLAPEPAPALVLSRATDRQHSSTADWRLTITDATTETTFAGRRVDVRTDGRMSGPIRRLPGATAAAQTGRSRPDLPSRWQVRAVDGFDHVEAEVCATAAAQLVLAEPTGPGYSYLHEIAVTFSAEGRVRGRRVRLQGLGIAERLD